MSSNQLGQSTSPHLLEHKNDPVHWRLWGPDAFAEAEATGRPILLSIGFSACHWCHVMNRESFSDPESAALINDGFIPVKVDREERPDIDQLYQASANILGHAGGWPLNIFLTPTGEPFFSAGYMPPADQQGQPSLRSVLGVVGNIYANKKDEVAGTVARLTQAVEQTYNRDVRGGADNVALDMAALRIGQRFDIFAGGLTNTQKFPSVALVEFLWRTYLRTGTQQYLQLVATSLDNMLLGGLFDHLGGGFVRYTEDERWMKPHFEKMLYDNAQLIDLMTMVWQYNRNKLGADRVQQTVEWLRRDMRVGDAFASSIDSDSEGEDGKYYLWSEEEVDTILKGTFASRFKTVYGVMPQGLYEGGRNALHRLNAGQISEADEALLAKQRERMLAARAKRVAPARDDKILADWNGLAIAALANAGAVFDRPEWIAAAVKAFDFIVKAMGEGDRLAHSWADNKRGVTGFSDDYANMARAGIQLWESTGDKRFVEQAKIWVRVLNENFWDAKGGYNFSAHDAEPLFARLRMTHESNTPPANALMVSVLTRLWVATGDMEYHNRVMALLQAYAFEINRNYLFSGSFLNGYECFTAGLHIVLIGQKNNLRTHEMARLVWSKALPNRLFTVLSPDESLPETHPAHGKTMVNDQPTVYICQRGTVSQPFTDPAQLELVLQLPRGILQQQQQQRRVG